MPIEVELHDGSIAEFPDGTAPDVMKRVAGNYAGLKAPLKPKAPPRTAAQAQPVPGSIFESEMGGAPVEPMAPTTVLDSFEARSAPKMPPAVPPVQQFAPAQARLNANRMSNGIQFDPEGADYDMAGARSAGLQPDETGHWPSRNPDTGMLLKGRGHETWAKTVQGEQEAGMEIYQGPDRRWYSRPTAPQQMQTAGQALSEIIARPPQGKNVPRVFATDDGGQFHGTPADFDKEHGKKSGVLDDAATYPDQWKYGASADIAAAARWISQVDAELARHEAVLSTKRVALPRALAGQQGDVARPANQDDLDKAQKAIPMLKAERDRLELIRSGADASLKEVTPKNPSTMSKAVGTMGRSAAPTLAGVATGMVAGPAAGYAVGVGLGALQQGAGTFVDVLEAGRAARDHLAGFDAQPDRSGYLQALLADPHAPGTVLKSAKRVADTVEDIDAKLKAGMLSSRAARQMTERAYGSFKRDMEQIARGAEAGYANVSAGIDAIAEGVGEAIGLGPLLRTMKMTGLAKSGFLPSFAEAVAANYGQEYATQLMQTLNARMRADPNVTLKEALEQAHEAGVGGALMGGTLHPPLYAAGKAAEKAGPYGGEYPGQPAPGFTPKPTAGAVAVRKALQPGTRGDLSSVLKDGRPVAEIRAEQAQQQTEAMAPHVEQAAGAATQQEMLDSEVKDATAEAAGIPKRGEQAIVTWPDGETARGTIRDVYQVAHPNTGEPMAGAQVELENGQIVDLTTADVKISAPPLGEGTPASPIVADTPAAIEQAGARADTEPTPGQAEAGVYRKGHIDFQGLNISIENPKGSVRRSKDPARPWEVTMPAHYGYVKRTEGADGDQVDVYVGDAPQSQQVWIVDQIDPATKKFDEHKAMIGFPTAVAAMRAYRGGFSDDSGPSRMGKISHVPMADFKLWLQKGDTTRPVAYVQPKEGLAKIGEIGGGIIEAMYDKLFADAQAGRTDEAGAPSTVLQVLRAIKEGGGTVTRENVPEIAKAVQKIKTELQGEDFQNALRALVRERSTGGKNAGDLRGTEEKDGRPGKEKIQGEGTGGGYVKPEQPKPPVVEPGKEKEPDGDRGVPREGEVGVEPPAPPVVEQPPVVQPPAPPVAQPPAPPVAPTKKERFVVDGKVETASGRMIPAPPALRMESDRKLNVDLKKLEAWLVEQAIDEAKAIGNELAVTMFGGSRGRALSQSDKDGMNVLLFGEEFPEFIIKKEPVVEKQPKEPKAPKEKKPELTASEKLHGEILDALENNDRDAMGKLIYQDTPVTDENRPEIDPADKIVRTVVKADIRTRIEDRLVDLGFKITDRQDVTVDGETKEKVLKLSAMYRPSKEKIGDFGEKIGGKRADTYNPKDIDEKLPDDDEKAVEQILAAIAKPRLVTAEMPGQSFGQFMFMEALWHRAQDPGEYIAKRVGVYNMAAWKAGIINSWKRSVEHQGYIKKYAKEYADTFLAVQKLVEGKQRVAETAGALRAGMYEDSDLNRPNELGKDFEAVWGKSGRIINTLDQKFQQSEDSTDQTNREVKKDLDPTALPEIVRKGKDWRKGANITDAQFLETFGFKGVDFGNWMTIEDRQAGLNYAYDAGMDLAELIGMPPKVIGLGGKLGFGIGSRGKGGKAAATFHPDNNVINLTKTKGDGTYFHEWLHALEHHMIDTTHTKAVRWALQYRPKVALLESLFRAKLSEDASTGRDRNVPPKERALKWAANPDGLPGTTGWWASDYGIRKTTNFYTAALKLDGGERGKYWSKGAELFARAWESYTYDATNGLTPYGVNHHASDGWWSEKNGFEGTPYPLSSTGEREYVTQVMKWFVESLELTDQGVKIKDGAKSVTDRQKEEAQKEVDRLVADVDKIMEEMGIRQYPEVKDGSMTESMFYHMRFGWWPKDKHELKIFISQAHKKGTLEVDDYLLRQGMEDFEAAMARYAGQLIADWRGQGLDERAIYDKLFKMYETQPTLDTRTSSVVALQQYSTPLPLAYGVGLMSHADIKSVGYDPTAGNGLLGITLNPKKFIANEMDDRRYKNLTILETRAHHGDALETHERNVYKAQEADVVHMNPPFGLLTDKEEIDGRQIVRVDQWIAVNNLDAMADKGRAVLIMGASRDAPIINQNELGFFHWLWANYNVVDYFELSGEFYKKQGAAWPVRVIVIAGRSPSKLARPDTLKIDRLESRDALWTRVLEAREKARTPVAGGVSPRVVGAGKGTGGNVRGGKSGNVGGGVQPGVPGKTGGRDGQPGAGVGAQDDPSGPGSVSTGGILPGGRGSGNVGGQPGGPAGVSTGEPGAVPTGEGARGGDGGRGTGGTQPDGTAGGWSGITEQDFEDIFGDLTPTGPKQPKIKTKRVGGETTGGPRAPRKKRDVPPGISQGDSETNDDAELQTALDAIDAILGGRAEAPKPFPAGAVKKSGNSTEDKVAGIHKTIAARVASEGEWWNNEAVDEILAAEHKPKGDDLDIVFMGAQKPPKGPEIDARRLQNLRPAFERLWADIVAKTNSFRDAMVRFRDTVMEKLGEWVRPYSGIFLKEKYDADKKAKQKQPIDNAIETEDQLFYQGLSSGPNFGIMVPASQLQYIKRALAALDNKLRNTYEGGIDEYVMKMVGYESIEKMHKHLGGFQVDGVALQIDAMENGSAFIVGDDTGVGKGRQAAALVKWAINTGRIPIFMTAQDNLYSDLYRDLKNIGFDNPEWMQPTNQPWKITDEYDTTVAEPERGEAVGNKLMKQILANIAKAGGDVTKMLPKGRKALFTTYAQTGPGADLQPRRDVVEALVKAGKAVIIMDEAHKAAGQSKVGEWLINLTTGGTGEERWPPPPVAFFSATFAKRADSLPLYMRTDLRKIAPTVPEVITSITEGGPQMQVTISEMLVEAGQMLRRERSYNGIVPVFESDDANLPVDTRIMDETTERLRAILSANVEFGAWAKKNKTQFMEVVQEEFQRLYPNEWESNVAAGDLTKNLDAFNFASTVHNYIKQFLMALKADRVVDKIVAGMNMENADGTQQKFLVGLENTMEAALKDHVEMEGLEHGADMSDYSWRTLLERAERRARTVSLKKVGSNDRVRIVLPLSMIPHPMQAAFVRAQQSIASFESPLPASPLDYMRWRLEKNYVWKENGKVRVGPTPPKNATGVRGFVTSEITGRSHIIEYDDEGGMTLGLRHDVSKRGMITGFQNGSIDMAILNISGTTGLSLHPNTSVEDQRIRHMLIVQPLGDINEYKQLSGRTNRNGQIELPLYTFPSTALPAEKRPLAVLRKKLTSLTSQTKSATKSSQDLDTTDFVNEYGDVVVTRWLKENDEYFDLLNLDRPEGVGAIKGGAMKVSGKIAVRPVEEQDKFYDDVERNYEHFIREVTESGENKLIRRAMPLKAKILGGNELGEGSNASSSPFDRGSEIQKLSVATQNEVPTPEKLRKDIDDALAGKKPGAVLAALEADLKVPFDESMNQVTKQIEDFEKQLEATDLPETERGRLNDSLSTIKGRAQQFAARKQKTLQELRNYIPGTVLKVNVDEVEYTAVVTRLGHEKAGSGNPYAPSKFHITLYVNAPVPVKRLTLARIEAFEDAKTPFRGRTLGNIHSDGYDAERATTALDTDFDPTAAKAAGGRETRYMVVGNIPAGFNMVKNKGEIVTFTYDASEPLSKEFPNGRAGVLLPPKFNPGKDIDEKFQIKNIEAGHLLLALPLHRAIVKNNLYEGQGYSNYKDFVQKVKDTWLDLEWTAEEANIVGSTGFTDNSGAVQLRTDSRSSYLYFTIDRSKVSKKLSAELIADEQLRKLTESEFTRRNNQSDWRMATDISGHDLPEILRYFQSRFGLVLPTTLKPLYLRIRDTLARKAEGDIKFMGMAVPTEPKGVSDETRKKVDNTSGRRLQALRRSVILAINRSVPDGMFTKGVLPRAVAEGLRDLEDFFGITALPFKNNNPEIFDFQGSVLRSDGDVFYINVDAPIPAISIAAHEGVHLIRNRDERLYQRLVTRIRPMMQGMDKYRALVTEGRGGKEASWDLTEEELIADILADAMLDPVFAAKLYGRDPTLFQRIYSYLIKLLDQLGIHLKKPRKTHKYVTDLQGARDVLSKVLNEHNVRPPADDTVIRFDTEFTEAMRKAAGKDLDAVLKLLPAWHGSPHDFDEFKLNKIGTGEGAQAYGWGLYFSSNKSVAAWYKDTLSNGRYTSSSYLRHGSKTRESVLDLAKRLRAAADKIELEFGILPTMPANKTVRSMLGIMASLKFDRNFHSYFTHDVWFAARKNLHDKVMKNGSGYTPTKEDEKQAVLDAIDDVVASGDMGGGKLYKVDLAPAEDEYLDLDKLLRHQEPALAVIRRNIDPKDINFDTIDPDITGREFYNDLARNMGSPRMMGKAPMEWGPVDIPNEEKASRYLGSIGIPGLTYKGASSGERNYVIFDDSHVKIEAKFMPAQPGGIKVLDKQAGREGMLPLKRFFYNPVNAFQKFPVIAALQRFAVHIETDMSKVQRRFMSEFEDLRKKLTDEQWDELADVLFVGDAEATEWTEAELREHGITDDKVVAAYQEFRTLITKVGRLVDMHRRSMLPRYRERKQALLERMRSLRNMTDPEFRALYGQRTRLLANIRAGGTATMNVEQLHARLDAVEMQLNVKREAMDEYQDLQEQVDQIDAILGQTSIRRRVGYVPHKFFGTFAIYEAKEQEVIDPETLEPVLDANGDPVTRPINVLVAGEHGFFPTQQDAIAAAKKYLADNPGADITVRPVQFKFPNSAATTLTDASYWRLLTRMGKQLGLHGQDLKDAMEGVARRRFRRRIAGFTKMRTGVEGFSRDLERVMQAHLQEASRYVYLDKLKYRAINDMERMGLSPFRSSNQQYPTLGPMVEAFLRDMNGQKSSGEAASDEVLDKLMSSKWGSPAVIGTTAGSASAAALMFGISTNPLLGLLIGSYVGYRFYSSLKQGGEFKTRALTGDMMSDMAHLKLGMLLNVASATVNLTQTLVNTLPVLKPKYTMIGFQKFEAALRSYVLGNPNADWRLLERTDAESINKFGEHKGARVMGTGSVKKLFDIPKSKMEGLRYLENAKRLGAWASMLAFDSAESLNRGVSFLGGYYRAKDEGKTPGESFREAEKVMLFTQHNYGKSNKPEIMRNVFARLPLQFKNYVWQQIAFTFDLARKATTGRSLSEVPFDRDALAYHLTSLFLLTGVIGMPLVGILAALLKGLFDYDIMDELKKKALEMQAHGKLAAAAATTIARGLPAAIFGEDLSSRAGMGEQFMPFDPSNPWGPWIGTLKNQVALAEMQASFVDQLTNISPAAKPFKAMEAMANGLPARDLILRPKTFFEALADDRIDWTNPWKNGYTEYDQTMISKRDVIRMGMGSTPTTVSELRDVEKIAVHETDKHKRKTRLYVNRVIAAARRFENEPAELNKVLDNVAAQMEKEEFMVSAATMRQSYRNAFTPRVLRTLKSVPSAVKPEIAGMIEPLMDRQRPVEEARP